MLSFNLVTKRGRTIAAILQLAAMLRPLLQSCDKEREDYSSDTTAGGNATSSPLIL